MVGERNIAVLARNMDPRVHPDLFVFCCFADFRLPPGVEPICVFREPEGLTAIVPQAQAVQHQLKHEFVAGLITLNVQSDLAAVGFLAGVTRVLSGAGVPCNVVSAFHHDHLFVPADRLAEAQQVLLRHASNSR